MPLTRSADKSTESSKQGPDDGKMDQSASKHANVYKLKQEKKALQSQISKMKKDLAKLRETRRELNFTALRNPELIEERHDKWKANVEMWSKYSGFTLNHVRVKDDVGSKETTKQVNWDISGIAHQLSFHVSMTVAIDESQKGHVHTFSVELPPPCDAELGSWISKNEGNIEQILKTLRAYSEMSAKREKDLEEFKKEFSDYITITDDNTDGGKLIELFTPSAYFYQIRWKLYPSQRHFGCIKNLCRIACTQDGNDLLSLTTDLATIKKRLNNAPKEVLVLLATGLPKTAAST